MTEVCERSGAKLAREIQPTDWSMAGNLSNRSSGVQIPRDICTRFGRYLYSTRCSWIIILVVVKCRGKVINCDNGNLIWANLSLLRSIILPFCQGFLGDEVLSKSTLPNIQTKKRLVTLFFKNFAYLFSHF